MFWFVSVVVVLLHHQLLGVNALTSAVDLKPIPKSDLDSLCDLEMVRRSFKSWLMWSRVRSAKKSWGNGPTRCTSSLRSCRRRVACLTWTACCLISPTPCSPWHKSRVPGPPTDVTVSSSRGHLHRPQMQHKISFKKKGQLAACLLTVTVTYFDWTFTAPYLHV